jgi:hypothetical protein
VILFVEQHRYLNRVHTFKESMTGGVSKIQRANAGRRQTPSGKGHTETVNQRIPVSTRPGSGQDSQLSWEYLAAWFDNSGSVYRNHNEDRLRLAGYDKQLLEKARVLLAGGSITGEPHSHGEYFRLTLTGRYRIARVLNQMLPYLQRKHRLIEDWLKLHRVKTELESIRRRTHLKRRVYVKRELRHLEKAIRQLTPPKGNGVVPPGPL